MRQFGDDFPIKTMIPRFGRTGFGRDEIYPDLWSMGGFNHMHPMEKFAKWSTRFEQRVRIVLRQDSPWVPSGYVKIAIENGHL